MNIRNVKYIEDENIADLNRYLRYHVEQIQNERVKMKFYVDNFMEH